MVQNRQIAYKEVCLEDDVARSTILLRAVGGVISVSVVLVLRILYLVLCRAFIQEHFELNCGDSVQRKDDLLRNKPMYYEESEQGKITIKKKVSKPA